MISRGADRSIVRSRSITVVTVAASLKTGTMMDTSGSGTGIVTVLVQWPILDLLIADCRKPE
jgi:hypothetical protein